MNSTGRGQDNPVDLLRTKVLLQVSGEGVYLVVETLVGDLRPIVDDGRLLGVLLRRDLQVVIDAGSRQR